MTFEDRVRALDPLGFSSRQTRFLVTVALHGGYCLRRHYTAFAGIRYGRVVRDFLDALVTRRLAKPSNTALSGDTCTTSTPSRSIEPCTRTTTAIVGEPAQTASRSSSCCSISYLTRPDVEWLVTEQDKVALFVERFGVPRADLPQRAYASHDQRAAPTARYFVHKLPIYLAGDPRACTSSCRSRR